MWSVQRKKIESGEKEPSMVEVLDRVPKGSKVIQWSQKPSQYKNDKLISTAREEIKAEIRLKRTN